MGMKELCQQLLDLTEAQTETAQDLQDAQSNYAILVSENELVTKKLGDAEEVRWGSRIFEAYIAYGR